MIIFEGLFRFVALMLRYVGHAFEVFFGWLF